MRKLKIILLISFSSVLLLVVIIILCFSPILKYLIEKYDELLYKLNIILFSTENAILLKDVYKIFLQKLVKLTLDDVNSGKITVLGLLETRAVEFEVVIICDFNESFIPKISVKDKFLSKKQKQF